MTAYSAFEGIRSPTCLQQGVRMPTQTLLVTSIALNGLPVGRCEGLLACFGSLVAKRALKTHPTYRDKPKLSELPTFWQLCPIASPEPT